MSRANEARIAGGDDGPGTVARTELHQQAADVGLGRSEPWKDVTSQPSRSSRRPVWAGDALARKTFALSANAIARLDAVSPPEASPQYRHGVQPFHETPSS